MSVNSARLASGVPLNLLSKLVMQRRIGASTRPHALHRRHKMIRRKRLNNNRCYASLSVAIAAMAVIALFRSIARIRIATKSMSQIDSKQSAQSFVQEWCNLENTEWYPGDWQERAPYFILAGAKKSGTTSVFKYLSSHPNLQPARKKELLLFLPQNFNHLDESGKTLVQETREDLHEHYFNTNRLQANDSLLGFEATPGYLFKSTTSPKYILCTCPWVKILLILRNPVERAWSNYNFLLEHVKLRSFEVWVKSDIDHLKRSGMLRDVGFASASDEYAAWNEYLENVQEGPVGRGMYAIQLQHWYDAMKAVGRDLRKDIFIVRNEDLKQDAQGTMNRIFAWLGVEELALPQLKEFMVSHYEHHDMDIATRQLLEEFYQPYNQRLYEMLGDDWQGVWDQPSKSK